MVEENFFFPLMSPNTTCFQEISAGYIFIPKSWQLYPEFKPPNFQFLSMLVPRCGMYWDVFLLLSLHAYIHAFDFPREKAILDTCLEVMGVQICIAFSWKVAQNCKGTPCFPNWFNLLFISICCAGMKGGYRFHYPLEWMVRRKAMACP